MKVALLCKRRGKLMEDALLKKNVKVKGINDNNVFIRCFKSIFTKADVYHADNPYIDGIITGLNALLRRKISSITIRGKDYLFHKKERHNFLSSSILGLMEPLSFLLANKIFFVCNDTKKAYVKKYPRISKKACVPYNGVDFRTFSAGKTKKLSELFPEISSKEKILIFVSNFRYIEKTKGSKMVFDAMKKIKTPVKLLVVGDGENFHLVKKYSQEVKNKIIFAGFRKDIPDLLKSSDIFIYSSFLDGLPTTVLEAQCAAIPVIVNNKDGIPESVAPGGGFIINNVDEFAEKINFLLDNPEERKKMGETAKEYMKKKFSWDSIIENYVEEWKKIQNE